MGPTDQNAFFLQNGGLSPVVSACRFISTHFEASILQLDGT